MRSTERIAHCGKRAGDAIKRLALVARETDKWAKLIRERKITAQ